MHSVDYSIKLIQYCCYKVFTAIYVFYKMKIGVNHFES